SKVAASHTAIPDARASTPGSVAPVCREIQGAASWNARAASSRIPETTSRSNGLARSRRDMRGASRAGCLRPAHRSVTVGAPLRDVCVNNDKVYIHERIEIRGHARAKYMQHMTANWCPIGRAERGQLCFGVWGTVGSTGRWPEVVNLWEE